MSRVSWSSESTIIFSPSRNLPAVLRVYFLGLDDIEKLREWPISSKWCGNHSCTIEGSLVDVKDVIRLQDVTDQFDKPWASDPWRKNDATSVSREEEPQLACG